MYNSQVRPSTTNVADIENAKLIAKRLFEAYDRDRSSQIENYEVTPMLQDTYRYMNKAFNPSKNDVESYLKVLDRNGDGRVTLADLENLVIRYLVGDQSNFDLRKSQNVNVSGKEYLNL